jgi:phosphomannomutase/phosphoglucomutase
MTLAINPSIFREYDIRGIAGRDLSPEFAEALGLAYAEYLKRLRRGAPAKGRKNLTVGLGRDCRLTSDSYADSLGRGLTRGGLDVIRVGIVPSPLTYFSVFQLELDGAIMVTGSHNPADYNGFKICVGKDTIHGHQIQELKGIIEAHIKSPPVTSRLGEITEHPITDEYIAHLVKIARPLKRKKIVLDAGNGTASTVAPELFKQLGADVIELFCTLDGRFPNHHPDPTVPANLKALISKIKEVQADFGVAFDGDSDRIGLVDEKGQIIFGDVLMVMLARDVLSEIPGATIISEVKSSHRLYNDIAAKGGKPLMWKTGHSLIKSKMKETKAMLAGEMSGHIFFADRYFGYDDAIYAALRVYEIASKHAGPVSSLVSDLPPMIATPEIRIDCVEDKKFALVEATKKRLAATQKTNDIDGVRVDFGDSWGLVRASNTQPVLVLRFEAPSEKRMLEVREIVESALHAAASEIGHPAISLEEAAH